MDKQIKETKGQRKRWTMGDEREREWRVLKILGEYKQGILKGGLSLYH
jgi:hypothetical protein